MKPRKSVVFRGDVDDQATVMSAAPSVVTFGEESSVAFSAGSSTALNSSLATQVNSITQDLWMSSRLTECVEILNKRHNQRRRAKILHEKEMRRTSSREGSSGSKVSSSSSSSSSSSAGVGATFAAPSAPLRNPYPIMPDRHRELLADVTFRAKSRGQALELTLFVGTEGKFLGIAVDADTGKHRVILQEGDRFLHPDCATWRVFPADRSDPRPLFLLQNVFSNLYLGVCPQGHAVCTESRPTDRQHLLVAPDEVTGLLVIHIPHWHWERGAPLCIRGVGKGNTKLWPGETRYLEKFSRRQHSENPARSLRCGYGGASDASPGGKGGNDTRPAHFQVTWRQPPKPHSPTRKQHDARSGGDDGSDAELSWLGLNQKDYNAARLRRAGREV